ncbi:hypothetical protein GSI_12633 [Ganoderma sinense ZZ0214-1]|uniref:Uncharacterized protein n=1 Tax=Ganoderma sinense ZZ0214-1 TaxID=1077348 RepID=A0A2G8RTA0_9APHY|nr:hypothetical protein GSI_12633 [Ganoderma sinense ZZ0214-1]
MSHALTLTSAGCSVQATPTLFQLLYCRLMVPRSCFSVTCALMIPRISALRALARSRDGGVLTHGGATVVCTPDRGKRRDPGAQAHPKGGRFITRFLAFNGRERAHVRNAALHCPAPLITILLPTYPSPHCPTLPALRVPPAPSLTLLPPRHPPRFAWALGPQVSLTLIHL